MVRHQPNLSYSRTSHFRNTLVTLQHSEVQDLTEKMVAETIFNESTAEFTIQDNVIIGKNQKQTETRGIAQVVLDSLSNYPDFVAQIDVKTGQQTTFSEIKDRSIRCALWLQKQGISKNDVVCISTPNQQDDIIPCLATFYVNAIYNPWYHELTEVNARRFFDICRPKIVFACEGSIDMIAKIAEEMHMDTKFVAYVKNSKYPSLADIMSKQSQQEVESFQHVESENPKKQVGVIYFSSGTTGIPKGTMLSYYSIVNRRFESCDIIGGLNMLWYSSLSWITGTMFMLACIRLRCTRFVHSDFNPENTSEVVEKYKVNWIFWTPSMLTQCYKAGVFTRYDFSNVRSIITTGSKLSKSLVEDCQKFLPSTFIGNCYGMTELSGVGTMQTRNCRKIDSVGFVVDNVMIKVIDLKTTQPLGPNQRGELCLKVDTSMLSYLKNPEQTRQMIDEEGWVHSGDLAYYDENGEVTIVDRIKEVIITQNHHVSPTEIEETLLQHPDVIDCAVVPVSHTVDIERPLAFVVKGCNAKVTKEELMELPASHNEYYRLTGGVVFVDELEYTSTKKKNLSKLKDMAKAYAQ